VFKFIDNVCVYRQSYCQHDQQGEPYSVSSHEIASKCMYIKKIVKVIEDIDKMAVILGGVLDTFKTITMITVLIVIERDTLLQDVGIYIQIWDQEDKVMDLVDMVDVGGKDVEIRFVDLHNQDCKTGQMMPRILQHSSSRKK
jgi:hypothetical protein